MEIDEETNHLTSLCLSLAVPPNIDDSLSSSDIIVREGANITLKCKATGSPAPTVKWKRDDNSKIAINKSLIGKWRPEQQKQEPEISGSSLPGEQSNGN